VHEPHFNCIHDTRRRPHFAHPCYNTSPEPELFSYLVWCFILSINYVIAIAQCGLNRASGATIKHCWSRTILIDWTQCSKQQNQKLDVLRIFNSPSSSKMKYSNCARPWAQKLTTFSIDNILAPEVKRSLRGSYEHWAVEGFGEGSKRPASSTYYTS